MQIKFSLALFIFILLLGTTTVASAEQSVCEFYVASATAGSGDGNAEASAAFYIDSTFWRKVQESLQNGPVTVRLLPGRYNKGQLKLEHMGHPGNLLTLQGDRDETIFEILKDSEIEPSTGLFIRYCQNVTLRGVLFTGEGYAGYISQVYRSQNVLIENCSWIDLPDMKYAATGVSSNNVTPETIDQSDSRHVIYRNCTFKRVGLTPGAHMIYNAYGPQDVQILDCYFEDCAGDYVRFRDLTDYGVVRGCTFKSTGTYPPSNNPGHRCCIAVRTYNDVDPGDEWLGTHFYFSDNEFIYDNVTADSPDLGRYPLIIYNSGFDPPGRHHILTPEEGKLLKEGADAERKAMLKANFGIDLDEFHMFSNKYSGEAKKAICGSHAAYGAKSKGWRGQEDVYSLLNHKPIPFEEWRQAMKEAVDK